MYAQSEFVERGSSHAIVSPAGVKMRKSDTAQTALKYFAAGVPFVLIITAMPGGCSPKYRFWNVSRSFWKNSSPKMLREESGGQRRKGMQNNLKCAARPAAIIGQ